MSGFQNFRVNVQPPSSVSVTERFNFCRAARSAAMVSPRLKCSLLLRDLSFR